MSDGLSPFQPRARVLVYGNCGNIGDAIQTVAMTRLIGGECAGVWRDAPMTDGYGDVPFVVNGFLGRGTPNQDANCLFAGVHLGYREPDYIEWIRRSRYAVGARDEHTQGLLAANHIASEMIGCATLTFPRYTGPRRGRYSVDVEPVSGTDFETSIIPDMPWADQWALALHRVEQLRKAELVYSRRLHVVLPCLAFGTPVIFPLREFRDLYDKSRLGLLHTLGFVYDAPVELDVTGWADRYIRFLSGALSRPIEPTGCPVMPVPILPPVGDAAIQLEASLDTTLVASSFAPSELLRRTTAPRISALVFTKDGATRLASCLESIQRTAFVDEIVVCIDSDTRDASVELARAYTPHVHIAPTGFPEVGMKLARGLALCSGDFVLRVDDDERLSGDWDRGLFDLLVRFNDITHFWTPRRWIVPPGDRFIASPPWGDDVQMRLFLNNPRILSFPATVHEHLRVRGRSLVLYDRCIDHDVLVLTSRQQREDKCRHYAAARPDHELSEFYLHEGKDLRLMPTRQSALDAVESHGARPRCYHAPVPYALGWELDFRGGGNAPDYTLGGWSAPESWGTWTIDSDAHVCLPLNEEIGGRAALVVTVQPFVPPSRPVCRTQVLYRGEVLDEWMFEAPGPFEMHVALPAARIANDRHPVFTFRNLNPVSPLESKLSTDPRRLGLGVRSLRLVADTADGR